MKVSTHCLGAMMFGPWGNNDEDECIRMIHEAIDAGVNFIDTADVYSEGRSEEIVGTALKGRRDDVVLATKVHGVMGKGLNEQGSSRLWIMREVENSLRRLQAEQPAADDDTDFRAPRGRSDDLEVFDGAIDEAVATILAGDRRHERIRAGRDHQLVVGHFTIARRAYDLLLGIDGEHRIVQAQRDFAVLEELARRKIQILGAPAGKEARQLHAVVRGARLLAENGDVEIAAARGQLLEEAVAHHAVADDDDLHAHQATFRRFCACFS